MNLIQPHVTLLRGLRVSLLHGIVALVIGLIVADADHGFQWWTLYLFAAAVALVFFAGWVTVPIGHRGVLVRLGSTKSDSSDMLDTGYHWIYPIPFFVRVEIVNAKSKALEQQLKDEEFHFDVWNLQRVTAVIGYVRWRIDNPIESLEHDDLDAQLVKEMVQASIIALGQSEGAKELDVLLHPGRTFEHLLGHVNQNLAAPDEPIPIKITLMTAPRIKHHSPQFYEFKTAVNLIEDWCARSGKSPETFFSMNLKGGRADFGSSTLDLTSIIEPLMRYFKGIGKW